MNKRIHIFLIILLLASFTGFSQKSVLIRIRQDESFVLNEFQTNITLKKKPFKFEVMLENTDGVYVFASIKDSVYRYTETSPIRDFSYLKLLELRDEDRYNSNRELNISEEGWTYWFYNDSADWHPYNRKVMPLGGNKIVCTKAIKQLYSTADGSLVRLRDISTPLYIFFIAVKEYDKDGHPATELMRRKLRIDWTDED
ncbi:MAG: hypothetical protein HZB42_14445 [Sphingobacteriales bacterium]|nr:hypothetical protein [Sphingobacteriales bacterium]